MAQPRESIHHEDHEDHEASLVCLYLMLFVSFVVQLFFQSSCAWKRLPVTPFDSSEARKTKTSVTSAGLAHSSESSSGSAARCMAVFMFPGSTQLTRTPLSSNSDAHVCDIPSSPNLEMP